MARQKTSNSVAPLVIDDNVPRWARKWIIACKELILPEWDVLVEMDDTDSDGDGCLGMVTYHNEYLTAYIKLDHSLRDDSDSHYAICHEFTHPILGEYSNLASFGFDMGHSGIAEAEYKKAHKLYTEMKRQTDEKVCTRLSRTIHHLLSERFQ